CFTDARDQSDPLPSLFLIPYLLLLHSFFQDPIDPVLLFDPFAELPAISEDKGFRILQIGKIRPVIEVIPVPVKGKLPDVLFEPFGFFASCSLYLCFFLDPVSVPA